MTAMTPSEVSKQLGIQPSTLRKYCLLLEEHGIEFERNANNSRKYTDMSFMTLQKMMTLIRSGSVTVEDAAYAASSWAKGETSETADNDDTENGVERHNGDIAAAMVKEIHSLKEEIKEQRAAIERFRVAQEKRDLHFVQILEDLQGQIQTLKERSALPEPEVRDEPSPDPYLVEMIEGLRAEIQQLNETAASKEEEPKEKKRFFSRLFK